jgi:hypothetical protein
MLSLLSHQLLLFGELGLRISDSDVQIGFLAVKALQLAVDFGDRQPFLHESVRRLCLVIPGHLGKGRQRTNEQQQDGQAERDGRSFAQAPRTPFPVT